MDIVNQIAQSWFGISGTELIVISVVSFIALAGLVLLRVVMKVTARIMALGCAGILGIALALWLLFVVLK